MKFRKKMTAILLTAIFMTSTLALAVSAEVYFEDFRDTEVVWGQDPQLPLPNGDGLAIEVWYADDFACFRATIPECYEPEEALASFTFDVDSDGIADFQIQYRGTEGWMYSGVDLSQIPMGGSGWVKDTDVGWLSVPSEFILTNDVRVFTLKLPMSVLSETYKFGFQANGASGHQIFYSTDPAHLWGGDVYKGDYTHSDFYVSMTRPLIKSDFVPGKGKGLDKPLPNENFAKGPGPHYGPHGPNAHANEHAKANARKHGRDNGA